MFDNRNVHKHIVGAAIRNEIVKWSTS